MVNTSLGIALLITFPDYPVATDTWYGYTESVGHAGVLLINPTGLTKYYEFGRYDDAKRGEVRNPPVPNATMGADGRPTSTSLKAILRGLSAAAKEGETYDIRAALFNDVDFDKMKAFATSKQPTYDITNYNCGHYAETVILQGNPRIDKPFILNPTPNNLVDEYIEEGNAEVTYDSTHDIIEIGSADESDAKQ